MTFSFVGAKGLFGQGKTSVDKLGNCISQDICRGGEKDDSEDSEDGSGLCEEM